MYIALNIFGSSQGPRPEGRRTNGGHGAEVAIVEWLKWLTDGAATRLLVQHMRQVPALLLRHLRMTGHKMSCSVSFNVSGGNLQGNGGESKGFATLAVVFWIRSILHL